MGAPRGIGRTTRIPPAPRPSSRYHRITHRITTPLVSSRETLDIPNRLTHRDTTRTDTTRARKPGRQHTNSHGTHNNSPASNANANSAAYSSADIPSRCASNLETTESSNTGNLRSREHSLVLGVLYTTRELCSLWDSGRHCWHSADLNETHHTRLGGFRIVSVMRNPMGR